MSSDGKWTTGDIPDQSGRVAVVTGANTGLGYHTAAALAQTGAHVVLAVRNLEKGNLALARIVAAYPRADVTLQQLDLSSLASVRAAAAALRKAYPRIDLLINNAGVMWTPKQLTADGFEMQFGTNHLGHFALTGLLLPKITDRVVTLSSIMHKIGKIQLDDLNWERRKYQAWLAYGQSKLADLMFAYELQHRLLAAGSTLRSMAAHPGYSATELQGRTESFQDAILALGNRVVAQSAEMGALPTLYAATVSDLPGGLYVGPDGPGESWGHPVPVGSNAASHDRAVRSALWSSAEQLTGVTLEVPAAA